MNADENELQRKKKQTAAIVCLVAGALIIVAAVIPGWIKSDKRLGMSASLRGFEWCLAGAPDLTEQEYTPYDGGECQHVSNDQFATWIRWQKLDASGVWGTMGWVTLGLSLLTGIGLAAAGGLGLKDRFVRSPVALTSVTLLLCCVALVVAGVFIMTKPGHIPKLGPLLGLSWPFFVFGTGIIAGIAGSQMLAKAHSDVRDPYWDGIAPEPPNS